MPLALLEGRVLSVVWPPWRMHRVRIPSALSPDFAAKLSDPTTLQFTLYIPALPALMILVALATADGAK